MKIRDLQSIVKRTDLWNVDPCQIHVKDGWNPRTTFDIDDLTSSIREHGVLMPLRLQKIGDTLYLIDGERRLRSTLALIAEGVDIRSVPAVVETSQNEVDLLAMALVANLGEPLSALDEAQAFKRLASYGLTQAQIATKVGRSPSYVSNRLTLLHATPSIIQEVTSALMTPTEAVKIIKEAERNGVAQEEVMDRRQHDASPDDAQQKTMRSMEKRLGTLLKATPVDTIVRLLYRTWNAEEWETCVRCMAEYEEQRITNLRNGKTER